MQDKIPELKIENNQVVLPEIDVPLKINGEIQTIKMRKISAGLRNQIKKKYTKTSYKGGEPTVDIDEGGYQEDVLSKAIIEAPFDYSIAGIRNLTGEVIDYLFLKYVEEAEPSEKKNEE